MLFNTLVQFADQFAFLNLFRYITFRTGGALITALIVSFICGPFIINWLKHHQKKGQPIRDDGPQGHLITKVGTPTMGGVMILLALVISTLLWADLYNGYIWMTMGVTISYGLIGFIDDYIKVTQQNPKGLPGKLKLLLQFLIAIAATIYFMTLVKDPMATSLAIPFFKTVLIDLGWFFIVFSSLVMVGSSNAVNLTDGLDGLAIVPVMIVAGVFVLIAYLVGNFVFSNYLQKFFKC